MDKVLLITKKLISNANGGREKLCYLNYESLKKIYNDDFYLYELELDKIRSIKALFYAFQGNIDGLNNNTIQSIIKLIQKNSINYIFIDGSNLGLIAKIIKLRIKNPNIYIFFHNVETKFFWDSFLNYKSLRSFLVFIVNYLAEKKSIKYATKIICLNNRDNNMLYKLFNRSADYILPLSIKNNNTFSSNHLIKLKNYALFVGGYFYANVSGIEWFLKNVASKIEYKIVIIGKGFENHKKRLEIQNNIEVIGEVDDVSNWYKNSAFVIAPIFSGSGMKTKVAEALMYGKMVYGTTAAFSGYENLINDVGIICNTPEDFINSIKTHKANIFKFNTENLMNIYLNNYSEISYLNKLNYIMKNDLR
jgi:hypothetical protein